MKIHTGKLHRSNPTDAGSDIFSDDDVIIHENSSEIISTKLRIQIDEGFVGFLKSRSGLSIKYGLEVGAGVIDSSYTGEVKVHLYNHGNNPYKINKGDKIAQLVVLKISLEDFEQVDELSTTNRGESGFGSTGK